MKSKRIQIRISESDYKLIKENLIDKNVNVSEEVRDFLIELATGEPKTSEEKILKILKEEDVLGNLAFQINKKDMNFMVNLILL